MHPSNGVARLATHEWWWCARALEPKCVRAAEGQLPQRGAGAFSAGCQGGRGVLGGVPGREGRSRRRVWAHWRSRRVHGRIGAHLLLEPFLLGELPLELLRLGSKSTRERGGRCAALACKDPHESTWVHMGGMGMAPAEGWACACTTPSLRAGHAIAFRHGKASGGHSRAIDHGLFGRGAGYLGGVRAIWAEWRTHLLLLG